MARPAQLAHFSTKQFNDQVVSLHTPTGLQASTLAFGACLYTLHVPDRHGNPVDVVLGHQDIGCYRENAGYLGATIGRNANRIQGGRFTLNGEDYQLSQNEGMHNLHSGPSGFDKRLWRAEVCCRENAPCIRYTLDSIAGEGGFPGNLRVSVIYGLHPNSLVIHYAAMADVDTIFNPTNHTYFNLNGEQNGYALDHYLTLQADTFTPTDDELIPTGELASVEGTPLDFRREKVIEKDLDPTHPTLRAGRGYDLNYCLKNDGALQPVATLRSDLTGIKMTVLTDRPGLQFYSGGWLDGKIIGKSGNPYHQYAGMCFETQNWPDAVNHTNFPSSILRAGKVFESRTVYRFETYLL